MLLDFNDKNEPIHQGQMVVTAGWTNGSLSSFAPQGIPIGEVQDTTVGQQETYQNVRLTPYADMRNLDIVQVATQGPPRPGVGG
jgi:cell shape-determining protein MreC